MKTNLFVLYCSLKEALKIKVLFKKTYMQRTKIWNFRHEILRILKYLAVSTSCSKDNKANDTLNEERFLTKRTFLKII